jgi:hypothetical protein
LGREMGMERGCSGWRCCFVVDLRIFWFVELGYGMEVRWTVDSGLAIWNLNPNPRPGLLTSDLWDLFPALWNLSSRPCR